MQGMVIENGPLTFIVLLARKTRKWSGKRGIRLDKAKVKEIANISTKLIILLNHSFFFFSVWIWILCSLTEYLYEKFQRIRTTYYLHAKITRECRTQK